MMADVRASALVTTRIAGVDCVINVADVYVVTSCENYTFVSLAGGRRLLIRHTMKRWLAVLPARQFVRVHRRLIVNLDKIRDCDGSQPGVMLVNFKREAFSPLTIKRRHWAALRSRLDAWRTFQTLTRLRRTEKSIAVLPFADIRRNDRNDLFCEGVSEELLNLLAKVPALRIAAGTSSFLFRDRNLPLIEIAHELDVDFLIDGCVRRSGSRVRVTAYLIDAQTGKSLWSGKFDRELTDILDVQVEIAGQIARNLQLGMDSKQWRPNSVDPDAHRLAIEGRHFWGLRTFEGLQLAEKAFTGAIAKMSSYASAHAGLADVCVVRAMYRLADGETDVADDLGRARASAEKALELDDTLAEPYATLGFALFHGGNLAEAARVFPRAFALNPSYATGYQYYAWCLCGNGRLELGLAEHAKAVALDPLAFINLDRYSAMLALGRRYLEALEISERAAALRPDTFVGNISQRAVILLALGQTDEAIATARTVRSLTTPSRYRRTSDADAIFVLQQSGFGEEASAYAAEILVRLKPGNYLRGFILAALGRSLEAVAAIVTIPSIMLPFLYWSPLWAKARKLTAFTDLLVRLNRMNEYQEAIRRSEGREPSRSGSAAPELSGS